MDKDVAEATEPSQDEHDESVDETAPTQPAVELPSMANNHLKGVNEEQQELLAACYAAQSSAEATEALTRCLAYLDVTTKALVTDQMD